MEAREIGHLLFPYCPLCYGDWDRYKDPLPKCGCLQEEPIKVKIAYPAPDFLDEVAP